jgi:hypothetical protein
MKVFKYLLVLSLIFLGCNTNPESSMDVDEHSANGWQEHDYFELKYLENLNPQVRLYLGPEQVEIGSTSTYRRNYSDFSDDGIICYRYYLKDRKQWFYKDIGKIVSGKLELYNFPSIDEIFINETTIRITEDVVYTFAEEDLLINDNSLIFERNKLEITPLDAHIMKLHPISGGGYSKSLFSYFVDQSSTTPNKELELFYESDYNTTDPQRVYDGILVILFDRDTTVNGNINRPFVRTDTVYAFGANNTYEIYAKKGWNVIWVHSENHGNKYMTYTSYKTNLSEMPQNLQWVLKNNAFE